MFEVERSLFFFSLFNANFTIETGKNKFSSHGNILKQDNIYFHAIQSKQVQDPLVYK